MKCVLKYDLTVAIDNNFEIYIGMKTIYLMLFLIFLNTIQSFEKMLQIFYLALIQFPRL